MFSFLTWNVAMMRRSSEAPFEWTIEHSEEAIRAFVVERDPDIVCFQELPGMVPYVGSHVLVPVHTRSHNGDIAILVRSGLEVDATFRTEQGFAVVVEFSDFTFANVHLAPGSDGAMTRLAMMHQILADVVQPLVVVGDTNMRMAEWDLMAELGFTIVKPPVPTWNSRSNRFNEGGAEYTAYYTNAMARGKVEVSDLEVWTEPVRYLDKSFHLSDHYPLTGSVEAAAGYRT
ncbi:MAG: hypothetical protein KJO36_00250 [Acidimicrobiia bacterium]|nr:hypothetical protein [Acidimicrobiia bacterium]